MAITEARDVSIPAPTPELPGAWLEQLAPGGRLIAPVGGSDLQQLQVLTRGEDGLQVERGPWVRFVPLLR